MSKDFKKLISDLQGDMEIIGEFFEDPHEVLRRYNVEKSEEKALLSRDLVALNMLGLTEQSSVAALSGAHSQTCH